MEQTTYTCDRCGHTQDSTLDTLNEQYRQFWTVGILSTAAILSISPEGKVFTSPLATYQVLTQGQHWCRNCCVEMGILSPVDKVEEALASVEKPTLDILIRTLIREEIKQS